MDHPVELRQVRYFVAVAEELHFGRAAARLHMSQSPLSRAIRELERDLGVTLFRRTTRQVELTPAGQALLDRARKAIAEFDLAIQDARHAGLARSAAIAIGYGPLSAGLARAIAQALGLDTRLEEDVTPELLRRVADGELSAAVVLATPERARPSGIRIDSLRDEPLLAALAPDHPYAAAAAIPVGVFTAERVLLPRDAVGRHFNAWLRAVLRVHGYELQHVVETLSAPWDHRMLPVAAGEAVSVVVGDWIEEGAARIAAVPFDPPLTLPLDLASTAVPDRGARAVVAAALGVRDARGWLTQRD